MWVCLNKNFKNINFKPKTGEKKLQSQYYSLATAPLAIKDGGKFKSTKPSRDLFQASIKQRNKSQSVQF